MKLRSIWNIFGIFFVLMLRYFNSNVIYKYKCNIGNDVYISEVKRHCFVRQSEYLEKSTFTYKSLKYNKKDATTIRKHSQQQHHIADLLKNMHILEIIPVIT